MSQLFTPYSIGPLTLENRIVIAPMCQYSAEEGHATDWHRIHLGQLALSGAGLLIIEATAVEPVGRISPADLGLWSDSTEAALGAVLQSVRKYSAMPIAIQLAHAGRKAGSAIPWLPGSGGDWQNAAPSALPFNDTDAAPAALDQAGLQRVLQAFVTAAQRSHRIGIDAIELHAAHGYLLHQFLSPLSNHRTDEYGGSLENRMRFPLRVFDAIRESVPASMPVGIRISATDWVEGGWDLEQSVVLAKALAKRNCAFIHVSSGGLSTQQAITPAPDYQVPLAARIRAESGLPTIAVGMVTDAEQAEAIVARGDADMVGVARVMLYDPHWPWHAAAKLGAQVSAPPQYWRSQPHGVHKLFKTP